MFERAAKMHLTGWDVLAALVGLGAMLLMQPLVAETAGGRVASLAFVMGSILARRAVFPRASDDAPPPPRTVAQKLLGLLVMVGCGLVALIGGIVVGVSVSVGSVKTLGDAATMLIPAGIAGLGAWGFSWGIRRYGLAQQEEPAEPAALERRLA